MKNSLNHLSRANSPYLLQHAGNPVDWYPWGEEALSRAQKENKPLIISIGYAACHWCHVMAHESFMDPEVAEYMNHHFVCIKVDREERPDIDQIYLEASQLISGTGGWPLNAFALPDGRPFYAGTYFTRTQWLDLLKRVIPVYETQFAELEKQADSLTVALRSGSPLQVSASDNSEFSREWYTALIHRWEGLIDMQEGGFTSVPKFPLPVAWEFLLQYHYLTGSDQALNWVNRTLLAIAYGGIYDHTGGGFSRYSTDRYWKVPHFEKMLYDNAQMISLFSHAYQVTRRKEYAEIIKQTVAFVQRELMNPEGAFYSSLDADSEGKEGKYYTYTMEEFKEVLDQSDVQLLADYYQVTEQGNLEKGKNILFLKTPLEDYARMHDLTSGEFSKIVDNAREKLMELRNHKTKPARDEKIITSWNALMIKALLDSYHALEEPACLAAAIKLAHLIEKNMFNDSAILHRSYKDGNVTVNGFLDDYAFYSDALIRLYESTFDMYWLERSRKLALFVLDHFGDKQSPFFCYTSDLSESLIARKPEITDQVLPSSNSVMVNVLIRLGHYFDEPLFNSRAADILKQVSSNMAINGPYFANYAMACGLQIFMPIEIAILGEQAVEKSSKLQLNYLPTALFLGGKQEDLPLLRNKLVKNATLIYVCKGKTCQLPVKEVKAALKLIDYTGGAEIGKYQT
jgi:hypothetical protein